MDLPQAKTMTSVLDKRFMFFVLGLPTNVLLPSLRTELDFHSISVRIGTINSVKRILPGGMGSILSIFFLVVVNIVSLGGKLLIRRFCKPCFDGLS